MPSCHDCGKALASLTNLRRHINSQHVQSEWHACECGRSFLDPTGRSRCRAGHSRWFGCSAWGCDYRSRRKDAVRQHIRRRHAGFPEVQALTFPLNLGYSGWPSSMGLPAEFSPALQNLIPSTPATIQPQVDVLVPCLSSSPPYYLPASPDSLANGITRCAYILPM